MHTYLKTYREMIALRGLTAHTVKSYSTYIIAYLNYLDSILHKDAKDVSWEELRFFIFWLQDQRNLSDRTINACISQLRFSLFIFYTNLGILINFLLENSILTYPLFLPNKK